MALVMLPCDMPWWPTLHRLLTQASKAVDQHELIPVMEKIINLCNVGLDETEETEVESPLPPLEEYLAEGMSLDEKTDFFSSTLPTLANRALCLKSLRPPSGLRFSLQQQSDKVELERDLLASLMAHAFFCTFPRRTNKTHPTLLDFNFTAFFKHLYLESQRHKFKCFLNYFNILQSLESDQKVTISRQVLTGEEWLTLDDWISCRLPLCRLVVKRQGCLYHDAPPHCLRICSVSSHIGTGLLEDCSSQECFEMWQYPETSVLLLFVESLEDNEALVVEGILQIAVYWQSAAKLAPLDPPLSVRLCLMDPEDYSSVGAELAPLLQYQEDCLLREVNKALTGFRQGRPACRLTALPRRLSPIGESFGSRESSDRPEPVRLTAPPVRSSRRSPSAESTCSSASAARRRFIVLGSSGECLPVSRSVGSVTRSECAVGRSECTDIHCRSPSRSVSPEYFSAKSSFTDTDDGLEGSLSRKKGQERSCFFAQRLKEALDRADQAELNASECRWGGEGSCGFVLDGESEGERKYVAPSSLYSFSTDYGSVEVDGWCEEVGRWLEEEPALASRAEAVVAMASGLLKRTLSETWAGVPLPGGEPPPPAPPPHPAPRSLSLELARLKAHIVCAVLEGKSEETDGVRPVVTSNWGCCSARRGEAQLKLLIQWLAASVALAPHVIYFTHAEPALNAVDTLCRVVIDRQWSVGELASAIVSYAGGHAATSDNSPSLFEAIIATDRPPKSHHHHHVYPHRA